MDLLLENRLLLDLLELGLEVLQAGGVAATVGAAACIGKVEAFILNFLAINTPVFDISLVVRWSIRESDYTPASLSCTILLGLLGIGIDMACLGKVAREVLCRNSVSLPQRNERGWNERERVRRAYFGSGGSTISQASVV
jgi:hypothetical protein